MRAGLLSGAVVETIGRELRRLSDVKIESDALRTALKAEVLKREVIEGRQGGLRDGK